MRIVYILLFLIFQSVELFTLSKEALIFKAMKLNKNFDLISNEKSLEEIYIYVDDDVKLNALYRKSSSGKLILYFHGNAGSLKNWKNVIRNFPEDYAVLVVDYRGYGKSDSEISSEEQFLNDGVEVYEYAISKFKPKEIIIYGRSIGSGVASFVASRFNPSKVILESPYYSLSSLATEVFPLVPKFLLRYRIESANFLKKKRGQRFLLFTGREIH